MLPLVPTTPAPRRTSPPSSFADRLPPAFGPVLALKGEDHYVRAIGAKQSVLVLIRLRDAIAELNAPGERVHRSWWVARAGTSSITRRGQEAMIQLSDDGTQVPVSAKPCPACARQAGASIPTSRSAASPRHARGAAEIGLEIADAFAIGFI